MAKRRNSESAIGEVLREIIEGNNLQGGLDKISVEDAWKNLMGNGVNYYTRAVVLKGSTLYVELTSAVLREELGYGRSKIIKMINEELGRTVVQEIIFR